MFKKFFSKSWPILLIFLLVFIFFWKFFLKGLVPMPADITVGLYFPWLDYKWGFPTGVPVKNPLPSDIPSLVYPWRILVVESLKNRTLPLWNPFYFGGMPLLANFQSATFSWVNLFFFFLPAIKAWSIGIVIQPLLTILFTFLFLRHLKIGKIASLLGSIVFAFSAFSLIWLEYNVHGHAAMWLPLLLLAVDRIVEDRKIKWVLGGSLFLALSIFAGYPQIVFYSLTTTGFYAVFRLFGVWHKQKSFKKIIQSLLLLGSFVVLGVLLSAVQWLPGYETMRLSVREIDPIASLSSGGFLPWQNLVTFLAPDFFGNPATYNFWGKAWYDNFALYVGILPLILVALAIFGRRSKETWFFVFLVVFALFLALPTPLGKWVANLGIYGVKSISARIIFLLDFSLAILAALGLDWIINGSCLAFPPKKTHLPAGKAGKGNPFWGSPSGRAFRTNPCACHPFEFTFIVFLIIFLGLWGFVLLAGKFFPQATWLVNLPVAKRNLILPTLLFFASTALLFFLMIFKRWKFSKLLFSWLFMMLIIFDLFRFGWKYLPFAKKELVFPTTPVIEFLQKQPKPFGVNPQGEPFRVNLRGEPFRVEFGEAIPQNMWMPYGLESAAGYDALAPLRFTQFLGAVRTGRADTPYGRVAQVENYDSKLFDLLNIKYVLAVKYDEKGIRVPEGKPRPVFQNPKFKLVFEDKTVQVYENKNVLPRAFLVHDFAVRQSNQEIIDQMLKPDFDLSKTVVLEENLPIKSIKTKINKIEWLENKPEVIKLISESEQPGFLLLTNNFYPGWTAFVDSKKTKIYRADFTFVAVEMPEGKHLIEFHYQPQLFIYGGLISLFSWANLCLFSLILLLKNLWLKR